MPIVMEIFANHVPLSDSFMTFTDVMVGADSRLEPKVRELLILRVAWRTQSGYEWHQHRRMGEEAGLTEDQLAAVPAGPVAHVWSDEERSLLTAADEMIENFCVSDETWRALERWCSPSQVLEALFVVGGYLCLATVLNSIGLRGDMPSFDDSSGEMAQR